MSDESPFDLIRHEAHEALWCGDPRRSIRGDSSHLADVIDAAESSFADQAAKLRESSLVMTFQWSIIHTLLKPDSELVGIVQDLIFEFVERDDGADTTETVVRLIAKLDQAMEGRRNE